METSVQPEHKQHSPKASRAFLNGALLVLATFLAIVYLRESVLIAYFAIASGAIAAVAFLTRLRQLTKASSAVQAVKHRKLSIFLLILVLSLPFLLFLLARFIEPTIWFLILASVASGLGLSEIILYTYSRTLVGKHE
jgi:phosphatidylglycerophosphate synthase